jgi:hypothetical protein
VRWSRGTHGVLAVLPPCIAATAFPAAAVSML